MLKLTHKLRLELSGLRTSDVGLRAMRWWGGAGGRGALMMVRGTSYGTVGELALYSCEGGPTFRSIRPSAVLLPVVESVEMRSLHRSERESMASLAHEGEPPGSLPMPVISVSKEVA